MTPVKYSMIGVVKARKFVGSQMSPGWKLYQNWWLRLELAHQAAAAVEFMHSQGPNGIVHCDLTSLNLLVTERWQAKVQPTSLASLLSYLSLTSVSVIAHCANWLLDLSLRTTQDCCLQQLCHMV